MHKELREYMGRPSGARKGGQDPVKSQGGSHWNNFWNNLLLILVLAVIMPSSLQQE
jgi:hypothetical protein